MTKYTLPLANLCNRITTKIVVIFRIITKQQKFSQCDPVLIRQFSKKLQSDPVPIRPKLASVLIQPDPVLIRAHLWCTAYLRSTTIVTWLTEHDNVIKSLFRGAPHFGLALGPASARAGPVSDTVEENVWPFLGIGILCIDHPCGDQSDEDGSLDYCVLFVGGKVWVSRMNEVHRYRSQCFEKSVYSGLLWDCLCIYHSKLQNRMSWLRHRCPGDWEEGLTVSDAFLMERIWASPRLIFMRVGRRFRCQVYYCVQLSWVELILFGDNLYSARKNTN